MSLSDKICVHPKLIKPCSDTVSSFYYYYSAQGQGLSRKIFYIFQGQGRGKVLARFFDKKLYTIFFRGKVGATGAG